MQSARIDFEPLQDIDIQAKQVRFVVGTADTGEEIVRIRLGVVRKHVAKRRIHQFVGSCQWSAWVCTVTNMVVSHVVETTLGAIRVGASGTPEDRTLR